MKEQIENLKVGTEIQYFDAGLDKWVDSTITKVSEHYVWFNGSGYDRIKKTSFITHSYFYRIKND